MQVQVRSQINKDKDEFGNNEAYTQCKEFLNKKDENCLKNELLLSVRLSPSLKFENVFSFEYHIL